MALISMFQIPAKKSRKQREKFKKMPDLKLYYHFYQTTTKNL